ncbi:MAG: L-threonylcarbamoyladenylate synthase [Thermodesulfobacteriota bacterium]
MTEAIKETNPESPKKAVSVLKAGGIIIYPTETLYGLGALALNEESVEKAFHIKGRPVGKPIPILVKDKRMLSEVAEVTDKAAILIDKFLPGPLTLVLQEKERFPTLITAGTGKIAVRISRHSFVERLFGLLDQPITSTSANTSGEENLFDVSEIRKTFEGKVELIVDSGNLPPSKGSTVVDLSIDPPSIIREGDISKEELRELLKW